MITVQDKEIQGVPVRVDIVPKGNYRIRPAFAMNPTRIAVHNTGNAGTGANAEAHRRLLHRNVGNPLAPFASYHFVVDEKEIVQLIPLNESAWATGDGSGVNSGNRTAIQIEICENRDGDYAKAEANAVKLINYLMGKCKIPLSEVKPHQAFSGKFCPRIILSRTGGWELFHKNIVPAPKSTPKAKAKPTPLTLKEKVAKLPVLKKGAKGEDVKVLQEALNSVKFNVGEVDGDFGAKTQDALNRFQAVYCNPVDATFGPKTKEALLKKM